MCKFAGSRQSCVQYTNGPDSASHSQPVAEAETDYRFCADLNLSRSLSVFLFDWDDTLFPTSALSALGPERLSDALKAIDSIAAELLTALLALPNSRVVILTNARHSWVQHAAKHFTPKVYALLSSQAESGPLISVISAHRSRSEFADQVCYEEAMRISKCEAIRPLSAALRCIVKELEAESFQVFSAGDQPHDLAAGHALRGLISSEDCACSRSFVKTIATKIMPTGEELAKQLGVLCRSLPKCASVARNIHLSMCPAPAVPIGPFQNTAPVFESGTDQSAATLAACPRPHDTTPQPSATSKSTAGFMKCPSALSRGRPVPTPLQSAAWKSANDVLPSGEKGRSPNADRSGRLQQRDRCGTWQGSLADEQKEASALSL